MSYTNRLNIKSWAEADRPREKFANKGKGSLSDAELIAILLGSGSRDETAVELAKRILNSVDNNLNSLGKLDLEQLQKFKGVGEAKAISIAAAMELSRRRKEGGTIKKRKITQSIHAFEEIEEVLSDLPHEEFWVLLLNRSNQVIERKNVSSGGVSGTVADAKMIFKPAIEKLASAIILCHNHPSGNLKASAADIALTKKLVLAGKNLDIAVIDHIIVGNAAYFSLSDEGLM
ncbi:MAG: DNA repair protein RadC [Vicingaceae bacterium]